MRDELSGWLDVGCVKDVPRLGSRVVKTPQGDIAVFRLADDRIMSVVDRCPHKGGPLSLGIVHGESVTCPLHGWVIGLTDGNAQGCDTGCTPVVPTRLDGDRILLLLPIPDAARGGQCGGQQ